MFTTANNTTIHPYIPLHYRHFPVETFKTDKADIIPMWSGEGNLSYLVINPATRDAFLIDPDLEILGSYLLTLDKENLKLVAVIDTHNHAEHATASPALKKLFNVPYIMNKRSPSSHVTRRVDDGDVREIAGISVRFIHTPGHTPDLTTVQIGPHLFTGDSLFNLGCGRADLPGGDAGEQYNSIHKLANLPADYLIHPGHDYNNRLFTTVATANRENQRLKIENRETFVAFMKDYYATDEKPDDLEYYVAFNAR